MRFEVVAYADIISYCLLHELLQLIPGPDYGSPIVAKSKEELARAYTVALKGDKSACKSIP